MKDWSSAVRDDDDTEDNQWDIDLKGETENGEHLGMMLKIFQWISNQQTSRKVER